MVRPLKQRALAILGYKLVPQNNIAAVERDGQFVRIIEGPNYVRANPVTERLGPIIPIGFGIKQLALEDVHSIDGDPYNIRVRILYAYDPRRCKEEQMTIALIEGGPDLVETIVQDNGELAIRHTVGEFETRDLRSGKTLSQLGRKIGQSLVGELEVFGVVPVGLNWVAITHISLSNDLEKAFEDARVQKVNVEAEQYVHRVKAEAEAYATKVQAEAEGEVIRERAKALESVSTEAARLVVTDNMYQNLSKGKNSFQIITGSLSGQYAVPLLLEPDLTVPVGGHQNGKSSTES